jgi:hypothetical protein
MQSRGSAQFLNPGCGRIEIQTLFSHSAVRNALLSATIVSTLFFRFVSGGSTHEAGFLYGTYGMAPGRWTMPSCQRASSQPWSDGTTGITLSPLERLEKLSTLLSLTSERSCRDGRRLAGAHLDCACVVPSR